MKMPRRMSKIKIVGYLMLLSVTCSILLGIDVMSASYNRKQLLNEKIINLEPLTYKKAIEMEQSPSPKTYPTKETSVKAAVVLPQSHSLTHKGKPSSVLNTTHPSDPIGRASSYGRSKIEDYHGKEHLKYIPNVRPVAQQKNNNRRESHTYVMPEDPDSYRQNNKIQNDKMKERLRLKAIEEKKERESLEKVEEGKKNLLEKLRLLREKKKASRKRIFYKLGQEAINDGNIGPFTETQRINKALKSIELKDEVESKQIATTEEDAEIIPSESPSRTDDVSFTESKSLVLNPVVPKRLSEKVAQLKPIANQSKSGNVVIKPVVKTNPRRPFRAKKPPKKVAKGKGVLHDIDADEISLTESEIQEYEAKMFEINELQEIHNLDEFGPIKPDSIIILIQVHSRVNYLKLLIESLNKARHINETLVIFSHDIWKPEINALISEVKSFEYMQIFFPFNVQTHPHTFPGKDPRDCRWNHVKRTIKYGRRQKACLNEDWPDTYNHYREPRYTQIKHHWWWKINRVFDGMNITRNWKGDVLFLEDDHYVAPDIIYTLKHLRKMAPQTPRAHVLSVGNFNKVNPTFSNAVVTADWGGSKYNLGFAFNRTTWEKIKNESNFFCTFDDYNWDWTLSTMMANSRAMSGGMLASKLTRVQHLGSCGTHSKTTSCDMASLTSVAKKAVEAASKHYFPKEFTKPKVVKNKVQMKKTNGGWKDLRDIKLCKAIANGTASEDTIESLQFRDFVI